MKASPTTLAIEKLVRSATGASRARCSERIQSLWDGYGEIVRVDLEGPGPESVVVKRVAPPSLRRRRDAGRSHARKLTSYKVELAWYQTYAERCQGPCRVARPFACREQNGEWWFVLEDLDEAGFPARRRHPDASDARAVLRWLAHFHATFLGEEPEGLWKTGTYWHLATRPDELRAMRNEPLRKSAGRLDEALNRCPFKTFVHGDAKVDNFCFPSDGEARDDSHVAAVDFQYVGGGCGMKDIAYFFAGIWDAGQCRVHASPALDEYFAELRSVLTERPDAPDPDAVEEAWRALYPAAWADFYRFLEGWAPGAFGIHDYAAEMIENALHRLG